jgi:hypothetical protein
LANRSDFFNAKLPRHFKRMMAMGETYGFIKNSHERGTFKRLFISAHANHVAYKMKRQSNDAPSNSNGEDA